MSRKLQRWKMSILQFNLIIKHISGFRNWIADFLSRSKTPLQAPTSNKVPNNNDKKLLLHITDPAQPVLGLKDLEPTDITKTYKISYNNKSFVTPFNLPQSRGQPATHCAA